MKPTWVWEPTPASGKREGGKSAGRVFQASIDTLVREAIQNSIDASQDKGGCTEIDITLVELGGGHLDRFLKAVGWDSLKDNLVADKRQGNQMRNAVKELETKKHLLCLKIEDRNTWGLTGHEDRENNAGKNRFCALAKDELYSDKDDSNAGGGFGLGKAVLWRFSAFNTVIFASTPKNCPSGNQGTRFIGRASLPFHETEEDRQCAGDGWFGEYRERPGAGEYQGRWAASIWGADAEAQASECLIPRAKDDYGLSTLIVGFDDPQGKIGSPEEILDELESAAMGSFWPAIVQNKATIRVKHEKNGEEIKSSNLIPIEHEQYRHPAQMLLAYHAGEMDQVDRLVKAGDRTVVQIPLAITEKTLSVSERYAHGPTTAEADLLVLLLDEKEGNEQICDRVFRFREPHMVVRNERTRDLAVSARPYVAVLVCGNAKRDCGNTVNKMEWFLRAAEPPAHDKWVHNTDALKDEYKTYGLKAAFEKFEKETKFRIKALVSVPEEKGGELPKDVTRYLKLGGDHGRTNGSVVTGKSKGQIENGIWKISSTVKCPLKGDDAPTPWYAEIKIQIETDDTARTIAIAGIDCEDATSTTIKNGVATVHFPANVRRAGVSCETAESSLSAFGHRAPAKISVTGAKIEPDTTKESLAGA